MCLFYNNYQIWECSALQTISHHFNIYASNCVALAPQTRYMLRCNSTSITKGLVLKIATQKLLYDYINQKHKDNNWTMTGRFTLLPNELYI